jgi:thiol-disulfide isomerase/thioredoxin
MNPYRYFLFPVVFVVLYSSALYSQTPKNVTLKGQIVCSVCWFEASDRKKTAYGNEADMKCALDCSEMDIPQALAVEDEKGFTLYTLEAGAFKPKGKDYLDLVPKFVEIDGELRTEKEKNFLKVNALKVLDSPLPKPIPASDDATLALKDLTGAQQSLAGYKGRVVVLNFWATWCEPCKKEMPDLSAIQKDYAAYGVEVIGAAGDGAADSAKVTKFIREFKVNFPVWVGATTDDMQRFGVGTVLPATVIIDRRGKIVRREIGMIKPAELREFLDQLVLSSVKEAEKVTKAEKKTTASSRVPA